MKTKPFILTPKFIQMRLRKSLDFSMWMMALVKISRTVKDASLN